MPTEEQIRLDYYLEHFHASMDYDSQMHIRPMEEPETIPAVMRARGCVQSSAAFSLLTLTQELDTQDEGERPPMQALEPLILFTSSEGEEIATRDEPEEDQRDMSPQVQHAPELLPTPEPTVRSEDMATSERSESSCLTTLSEGRVRPRRRRSRRARNALHQSLAEPQDSSDEGLEPELEDKEATKGQESSEGDWESCDSSNDEDNTDPKEDPIEDDTPSELNESFLGTSLLRVPDDVLEHIICGADGVDLSTLPSNGLCLPGAFVSEEETTTDTTTSGSMEISVSLRKPIKKTQAEKSILDEPQLKREPSELPKNDIEPQAGTSGTTRPGPTIILRSDVRPKEFVPSPRRKINVSSPKMPTVILRKRAVDPGLNPPEPAWTQEGSAENKEINFRIRVRNTETWTPGAERAVDDVKQGLSIGLDERIADRTWQRLRLPAIFLIPKNVRMSDWELAVHARRAENMWQFEWERERGITPTTPQYPEMGMDPELWCLFCCEYLVKNTRGEAVPTSCKCTNTRRYGEMRVESNGAAAQLLMEKFWACRTFAEAQEFLLTRLNARYFTQGLDQNTTLVAGIAVDE